MPHSSTGHLSASFDRILALSAFIAAATLSPTSRAQQRAAAAKSGERIEPHRVGADLGQAYLGNTGSGEGQAKNWGVAARLAYGFRALKGFEIGGDLSYWYMYRLPYEDSSYHYVLPAVVLRPYLPLGSAEQLELGFDVHAGALIMHIDGPGTWTGVGVVVGPDARVWLGRRWAVQLGAEFAAGTGHNPSDRVTNTQSLNPRQGFLGLGFFLGCVARF